MPETFNSIINRVRTSLLGLTQDQEQYGTLSIAMGASDTTFTVDPATASNMYRGTLEVDDELILIQSVDRVSGTMTVQAGMNGRGWNNTNPTIHAQGSLITMAPSWPRARVKEAINDTIASMYPSLVVFGDTEITRLAPVHEYELPQEVDDVWYVTGSLVGPTKIWQPLPNWRYNPMADPTAFPSGKSIQLFDFVTPGQPMRVVYAKVPQQLVNDTDAYAATTGFEDDTADIVTYGAMARLLPMYEASRLQQRSIESTERATLVVQGSAMKASQYYMALYQQRLDQERVQQLSKVPNYATFQGS